MGAPVKMAAPVHPLSLQASQELSMVATPSFPLQLVTLVKHSRSCPQWHTSPVPSCLQQLHRNAPQQTANAICIWEGLPTLAHGPDARKKGE